MAPGHVFHPGHDEWHGQTVVVHTSGPRTVIGRWDAVTDDQVLMRDAAVHEEGAGTETRQEWIARVKQYGVPVEHATFTFPHAEVSEVVRLRDA
jgi:hypothetical protein